MSTSAYQQKIEEQLRQYAGVTNIHDLPEIHHYWAETYLIPRVREVFGVQGVTEFYQSWFCEAARRCGSPGRFLSVGAGDCSVEVEVARLILQAGLTDFTFECLDLSPELLGRGRQLAEKAGLTNYLRFIEADINAWKPGARYHGVMAHHSLHHFVELEVLFDRVRDNLAPRGVFVTNDVIGRNGHQRWPETLEIINKLWAFLPDHYKYHHLLAQHHAQFVNWDCSNEGFEGIRAQDILPLLVERFSFEGFVGYGGLVDVFFDRGYGHNIKREHARDVAFIDLVAFLEELLTDLGYVKPTAMYAVMGLQPLPVRTYRHWTPEFCVRPTVHGPARQPLPHLEGAPPASGHGPSPRRRRSLLGAVKRGVRHTAAALGALLPKSRT